MFFAFFIYIENKLNFILKFNVSCNSYSVEKYCKDIWMGIEKIVRVGHTKLLENLQKDVCEDFFCSIICIFSVTCIQGLHWTGK